MTESAATNRRTLWLLFGVAVLLFVGSILFIVSRTH